MKFVYLAVWAYVSEWFVSGEWEFLLGNKYLIISLLATALLVESKNLPIYTRSILALVTLTAYADLINYILWQVSQKELDFSIINALVFFTWLLFTIKRKYPEFIDRLNHDTVNILVMKPKSTFDVFKGLIGFPAASICIYAGGYVWTFRKHTGKFERVHPSHVWLDEHLIINTFVTTTPEILNALERVVGEKRSPYCKCIYSVRHVLNMLGEKYEVKKWWDYIPGIYALKILR